MLVNDLRRSVGAAMQGSRWILPKMGSTMLRRQCSTSKLVYSKLTGRSLFSLKGEEVLKFLQGLVTNDVKHFDADAAVRMDAMYALILNTQGRILFDVLLYNRYHGAEILLECDRKLSATLQKTLSMYRLRKKIDIDRLDDQIDVYSMYPSTAPSDKDPVIESKPKNAFSCPDPRLAALGNRVLLDSKANPKEVFPAEIAEAPELEYHRRRYCLGVGEGNVDLPTTNCFPLESNADYLKGVSFHKGCYVGQELTARTHHTGVVRKRLMPLVFGADFNAADVAPDAKIVDENKEIIGKYRNACSNMGLALMRVDEALKATHLFVQTPDGRQLSCHTSKPFWWLDHANLTGEIRGFHPTRSTTEHLVT